MDYINYKDLSFTVTNEEGEETICDVLSVVPNEENKNEPYVVFTDYLLDKNDEFVLQFGRVIEENGEYKLMGIEDTNIIKKIREQLENDVVSFVNKQFQDSLND